MLGGERTGTACPRPNRDRCRGKPSRFQQESLWKNRLKPRVQDRTLIRDSFFPGRAGVVLSAFPRRRCPVEVPVDECRIRTVRGAPGRLNNTAKSSPHSVLAELPVIVQSRSACADPTGRGVVFRISLSCANDHPAPAANRIDSRFLPGQGQRIRTGDRRTGIASRAGRPRLRTSLQFVAPDPDGEEKSYGGRGELDRSRANP